VTRKQDRRELAEFARDKETHQSSVFHVTPEELQAIDEALGQVARGEIASRKEIEAAFAKFRGES
jgi:K+/H+ antiporter YhaU regulatory subunit KhtT